MNRRRRIYEGKAKILYEGPEPGTLIQFFKDDATAFNKKKHDVVDGKGVLNNRISEFIFSHLNRIGMPTHFIKPHQHARAADQGSRDHPARGRRAQCRRRLAAKRLGIEEGTPAPLDHRVLLQGRRARRPDGFRRTRHRLRLGKPPGNRRHHGLAIRVNDFLTGLFLGVGIQLVDFKIECGRLFEGDMMRIVVADEISPDSCRLWDVNTNEKLDKDVFRRDLGNLVEAYQEVARRLGIMNENEPNRPTGPVLVK
jgi:phosphoribosylaminoimidazole-succinocarboxamide synthase